jgi:hypothetical protein
MERLKNRVVNISKKISSLGKGDQGGSNVVTRIKETTSRYRISY